MKELEERGEPRVELDAVHQSILGTRSEDRDGFTLCYAIVLPGMKSDFRAGLWPDCYRENT